MGPLLFVAAALVIFIKYRLFRKKRGPQSEKGDILKPLTDKAFGLIIFAVVFVFYLIAVPFFVNNSVFGGDQPHYLIISHSIVEDGDIYIKDDHDSGIAEEFTELHIEPQFLKEPQMAESFRSTG